MSNTIKKRFIATLAALLMIVGVAFVPVNSLQTVSAAGLWPSLSTSAYCEFTVPSGTRIPMYADKSLSSSNRGYASPYTLKSNATSTPGDIDYIYEITDSYILLSYPVGSRRVTAYCRRSDIISASSMTKATATGTVNIYKRPGSDYYGYYEHGDEVFKGQTSGGYTFVVYTAKSGSRKYKAGWARTSDVNATTGSSNNNSSAAQKLLAKARGEIGYYGKNDYSKYGMWTGTDGQPWCAAFTAWCADQAGVSRSVVPKTASCENMASWSSNYRSWNSSSLNSIKPGDVVFFSRGSTGGTKKHVGIVSAVNGNRVSVIEGNTSSDYVKENTYTVNTSGYINQRWTYGGTKYYMYFGGYISV